MIDVARDFETGSGSTYGDTGSGDYTTLAWVTGVGKGATITPAGGDTGKTLFVSNTGYRQPAGNSYRHGTHGRLSSANESSAPNVWRLAFYGPVANDLTPQSKLMAYPLRCVRS